MELVFFGVVVLVVLITLTIVIYVCRKKIQFNVKGQGIAYFLLKLLSISNMILLGFDALFKKEDLIGKGAFGEAWKVTNRKTKETCVMKMLTTIISTYDSGRNEVEVLKSVNHDHLVRYVKDFFENGKYLMVMEFCSGGDLKKAIDKQKALKSPFAEDVIFNWFGQLISGLKYMKEIKILHRDLKPNNVFLTSDNKIKIGDFGLAKMLETTYELAQTKTGARIYMAPERHRGERYSHKVDVWALGCILYELCTLKHTFTKIPDILLGQYEPIPDGLHPGVSVYIPRLLCMDPNRRPSADKILAQRLFFTVYELELIEQFFSGQVQSGQGSNGTLSYSHVNEESDFYTNEILSGSYV